MKQVGVALVAVVNHFSKKERIMSCHRLCYLVIAAAAWLIVPLSVHAQGPSTVTKWRVQLKYKNDRDFSDYGYESFDTRAAAEAWGARAVTRQFLAFRDNPLVAYRVYSRSEPAAGPNLDSDAPFADTFRTLNEILTRDVQNLGGKNSLRDVRNRVNDLREYLDRNVDKLSTENFNKANALVAKFNSIASRTSSAGGPSAPPIPLLKSPAPRTPIGGTPVPGSSNNGKPKTPWVDTPPAPLKTIVASTMPKAPATNLKPITPSVAPAMPTPRPITAPTPAPTPAPVPAPRPLAPAGLAGSSFSGQENLAGYSNLQFRFFANGQAQMIDTDGTQTGNWQQNGSQVTLRFYNGSVVYSGTLQGNRISGSASNNRKSWNWSVSR